MSPTTDTTGQTPETSARPETMQPCVERRGGPPFWEEWRGTVPDEDIEFVRFIFENFCGSWE